MIGLPVASGVFAGSSAFRRIRAPKGPPAESGRVLLS